jgi:prevent-host-death family protein
MTVTVGVRELRENLRAFLDRVKAGEEIVITERGEPIARLSRSDADAEYQRLIDEGKITPARRPRQPIDFKGLPRLRGRPTLTDILLKQRGSSSY